MPTKTKWALLTGALLSFCLVPSVKAQVAPTVNPSPGVPTPESVLGYPVGTYHTNYAGLERWLAAIRGSERVRVVRYGESVEKRPLYLIIVSSPANDFWIFGARHYPWFANIRLYVHRNLVPWSEIFGSVARDLASNLNLGRIGAGS